MLDKQAQPLSLPQRLALTKVAAIGPYDIQQSADVAGYDDLIAGVERNRHERPLHYWLNPFVMGPLSELALRYGRRANAGTVENWPGALLSGPTLGLAPAIMGGRAAKNQARDIYQQHASQYDDAEEDELVAQAKREPKQAAYAGERTGPFSGQEAAAVRGTDKTIAGLAATRKKHPAHYYLNPFVGGPITELLWRMQRRFNAGRGRNFAGAALGVLGGPIGGPIGGGLGSAVDPVLGLPGRLAGEYLGMAPTTLLGTTTTRDNARKAHEAVNMPYHEEAGDRDLQAKIEQLRKQRAAKPVKQASFVEKLAMKPMLSLTVRRLTYGRRQSRMPSVRGSDNKTPSTNDMAKSKDAKGAFTVE